MEFELVLGLEVHLQLKTQHKMFCYCDGLAARNDEVQPNTYICPVCLGLPGSLPVPNKEAIMLAQKMAYALGGNLCDHIVFERKNYFYPDLPKGYQITCPRDPIAKGGEMDISFWAHDNKAVKYRDIHLEEDTGKSIHTESLTLLDYNKSGIPLLEIVTEPDFKDVEHAICFCKEIQRIARALNASDADLEKGHMRLEANISVRKKDQTALPHYRVELKNINSFSFLRKAINYEFRRQVEVLKSGGKLVQETRGFNENTNKTFSQRNKEEAHDYRYFTDPDIPIISFDAIWMKEVMNIPELPPKKRELLMIKSVSKQNIEILIDNEKLYKKFEALLGLMLDEGSDPQIAQKVSNLIINVSEYKDLTAKKIFEREKEKKSSTLTETELRKIISDILDQHQEVVDQYNKGKENAIQFLIGQVMKEVKGVANPSIIKDIIISMLNS